LVLHIVELFLDARLRRLDAGQVVCDRILLSVVRAICERAVCE